jgi:MFS family permease
LVLLLALNFTQVVSSTLAGAAVGSLTGGSLAEAFGRRASFMLCALPMLAGPVLSAAATSINVMIAGRFLAGVAIGLSSALVPLYISEVGFAKKQH